MRDHLILIGKRFLGDAKRDDLPGLAAELAYRFLFAVFPFGIFAAALTAFVAPLLGFDDPTRQILGSIGDNLPAEVADAVRPQLEAVLDKTQPGLLTIGAVAALWAATGGTNALIKAMNRAYEVEETRPLIPRYGVAIGLTLLASIGLVGAFVTIVGASLLTSQVAQQLHLDPGLVDTISLLRWPVVFGGVALAVGVLYKLAPNFRAPWRWCLAGGAIFALGWLVATAAFGLYVANFATYSNTYGALGGVVVLMLWFYLSATVMIGAAGLVAAALKELQPATFAAGRAAADEAVRKAAAKEAAKEAAKKAAKDDADDGRPIEAAAATASATATGISASAAGKVQPGARRPTPLANRRATTDGRSATSIVLSGAVIAAGVTVGALVARLLAPRGQVE